MPVNENLQISEMTINFQKVQDLMDCLIETYPNFLESELSNDIKEVSF